MTAIELIEERVSTVPATLFSARNLVVDYRVRGTSLRALNDVSVGVAEGEALGLIGESGSGKTTLLRALVGLVKPVSGTVTYRGEDIYQLRGTERHRRLGRDTALVFQDPRSSLNPRLSVGSVIKDPMHVHGIGEPRERPSKVAELLDSVGLPRIVVDRPVRSLSGGQLQRVALARALAVDPSIIVFDEPTSALDVSIQAQILNLLQDIRQERRVAMVVVSHDIRVIRYMTDNTAVMYKGEIVESGSTKEVCERPLHEYTKTLLAAVPTLTHG